MVLYYMEHPSQLFKILIHKMNKHTDEKAVFLVCDVSYDSEPINSLKVIGKKSFNIEKIIKFPHAYNWLKASGSDELIGDICGKCDQLFAQNSINISNFNKVYISRDSGVCFENYCMIYGVHYKFYETICNTLIKHLGSDNSVQEHKLFNYLIDNKNGENCVDAVITTVKDAKKEKFKNWEYYDFTAVFQNFSNHLKKTIYDVFKAKNIINQIISGAYLESSIFGPNSSYDVCVMKNLNLNDAYLANELLLDYYFCDDNIVLKPHPLFDIKLKTDKGYVPSISSDISIEMLKTAKNFRVKKFITVASSAADEMEGYADEVVRMGWDYNSFFVHLHKYCAVLDLLVKFAGRSFSFSYNGQANGQIEKLIKYRYKNYIKFSNFDLKNLADVSDEIVIINELNWDEINNRPKILLDALNKLPPNKIVCFIPDSSSLTFVDNKYFSLLQYIIPISITKSGRWDDIHSDMCPEYVFLFCKNKQIREGLANIRLTNKLKYSGLNLNIGSANDIQKNFIELSYKQKIDAQNLEGIMRRFQYAEERKRSAVLNTYFLFGFRENEYILGDGFQMVCDLWNTHSSPGGKFKIKRLDNCIEISIINKGEWNNLEQWVNMSDILDYAGKSVNIIVNLMSSTDQIKYLYVDYRVENDLLQHLVKPKIVTGHGIVESGEFKIPDNKNGRLVFGLSLNNETGVSCRIESFKVQIVE